MAGMKHCGLLDCGGIHYSKGLCRKHYDCVRYHGTTAPLPKVRISPSTRFWRKVNKNGTHIEHMQTRCWEWTGARITDGYGSFKSGVGITLAHRFAWRDLRGTLPDGLLVLHRCDNPSCVNPEHLFLGTQFDNMRDMVAKGRWSCGVRANAPAA